jgi:hypothetical protein
MIWQKVAGWDKYEVSDSGCVRNSQTGRILKERIYANGYRYYRLCDNGNYKDLKANRLVAIAFMPNPENKKLVDHIDRNILNDRVENLRWSTHAENRINAHINSNNSTGSKGVYFDASTGKYKASITFMKRIIGLGYFSTQNEASTYRKIIETKLYGEFTCPD